MRKWKAKVKLPGGYLHDVIVEARNFGEARAAIEAQYGKGSIVLGPTSA